MGRGALMQAESSTTCTEPISSSTMTETFLKGRWKVLKGTIPHQSYPLFPFIISTLTLPTHLTSSISTMHPLKTIVTAASAFAAAVNAVAIPTVDVAVSPAIDDEPPLTPGEVEAILEKRDNAMFTIGYALCSYTVFGPVPTGWSTEKHFFWPGQYDVGCVEHDKSPQNIVRT